MITAYDFPNAEVAEEAGVDVVLVGDSGAMTVLGYPSTVPVTLDELLMLASAARRAITAIAGRRHAVRRSYEVSNEQAIADANHQGGGLRRREARARWHLRRARPRDRRGRHPGDGARGAHAPDSHGAGRLPLPGPHRRARHG